MFKYNNNQALVAALFDAHIASSEPTPVFGATLDDIIGAAMGAGSVDDELSLILSGESPAVGYDDIIGAVVRKAAAGDSRALQQLALLKAAGQRGVVSKSAEELKWEKLPIPALTLAAGQTLQQNVRGIRSQRLDQLTYPSSVGDHQFILLLSIEINGTQQLNGSGGILLSELSELNPQPILRGSTAQRNEDIIFTYQNLDAVNPRTLRGSMGGPTLRIG